MKKITQLAFVVFLLVSASGNINAQENARLVGQGKIVFDISYPNNKLDEQSLALLPSESVVYFKGNMSRVETRMGIGTTVIITDHKLGESTTL
ncbi:MAG TPA: hypothetical protein PKL85_11075, partial [Bacteroidia bacterium]|nr:hypothetical protein [Bacteroidia bacterium]